MTRTNSNLKNVGIMLVPALSALLVLIALFPGGHMRTFTSERAHSTSAPTSPPAAVSTAAPGGKSLNSAGDKSIGRVSETPTKTHPSVHHSQNKLITRSQKPPAISVESPNAQERPVLATNSEEQPKSAPQTDQNPQIPTPPPEILASPALPDIPSPSQPPAVSTPIPRAPYTGPSSGVVIWSGNFVKNEIVTIDGDQFSSGSLVQGRLPGVPVIISVSPGDILIKEPPSPANRWTRVVLWSTKPR